MGKYWELAKPLPNNDNQKVINQYLLHLKDNEKKEITINNYRRCLQKFFNSKKEHFSVISSEEVQRWLLNQQQQKGWKESTKEDIQRMLYYFFIYCVRKGYIQYSPIQRKGEFVGKGVYWELKQTLLNKENENVVLSYLLYLKNKDATKEFIRRSRFVLQEFFREQEKAFYSITSHDVEHWCEKQGKKKNKATLKNYKGFLRAFYNYCVQEGYIENPPITNPRALAGERYWEIQQPMVNKKNLTVANEFLLYLKNQGKAKQTIKASKVVLLAFLKEKEKLFSEVIEKDITNWVKTVQKDYDRKTLLGYLSYFRSFYRFCLRQGYVEQSPVKYYRKAKSNQWEFIKQLPNKENQKIINEFLLSMKVANMSQRTIDGYGYGLLSFFREQKEPFDNLTSETFHNWLLKRQEKVKEVSLAGNISVLSSFYKFCVEEGYMQKSPIKSRWFPRLPKPVPKYLDKKEIAKLRYQSEKETIRNHLIIEFLLVTGCRIGEIQKLNKEDIDLDNRTARVVGKGSKIRTVHFTERCALLMERYLKSRDDDNPGLFVSSWGERIGINAMQLAIKEIGERSGLEKSLYPHRLRHTFATDLATKGADLLFISEELGHENLDTTQGYARLLDQQVITLYRRFMG